MTEHPTEPVVRVQPEPAPDVERRLSPLLVVASTWAMAQWEALERGLDPRAPERGGQSPWLYVTSERTVLGRAPGWYAVRLVEGRPIAGEQYQAWSYMLAHGWRQVAADWRAGEPYR